MFAMDAMLRRRTHHLKMPRPDAYSTMATRTGTQTISYAVSAGTTSSNLTATLISVELDTNNKQVGSEQDAYLIDTSGGVTLQSVALSETVNGILLTLTGQ
jgi:hypothetical protein